MPGGQGMGEGVQQLALFFMFVLFLVFGVLAIRTEWDRRHGKPVPEWSQVLDRRKMRGFTPPQRTKKIGIREGDVI